MSRLVRALAVLCPLAALHPESAGGSPLPGQIVVDPDSPSWMRRHGEGPFFLCGPGDPEGFLYRGSLNADGTRNGDQSSLIAKVSGTGANSIYMIAVRSHGGDGTSTENPFVDHESSNGLNDAVLDQWEGWFDEMEAAGIVVFFIFYDDESLVWDTGDRVGSREQAFLEGIVDRFEHHPNLIWCVAEEYQESYSEGRIRAIAATIRDADDHDHPIAVHETPSLSFDFPNETDVEQFAVQHLDTSPPGLHDAALTAWNHAEGRYQLNFAEYPPAATRTEARKQMWAIALGGAYVMVLGMDIASTPIAQLEDCGRLARLMESVPLGSMSPRDDLAWQHTDYVLADPGNCWVAYATGATETIGVRSLPAGGYELEWLDCTDGDSLVQSPVFVTDGHTAWPKPAGFGNEVALVVRYLTPTSSSSLESSSWTRIKAAYRAGESNP